MDALERSDFIGELSGQVYLSQNKAFAALIAIADAEDAPGPDDDPLMARGLI